MIASCDLIPTTRKEILRLLANIRHNYASLWSCTIEHRDGHRWELYKLSGLPAFEIYRNRQGESFTVNPEFVKTFGACPKDGKATGPIVPFTPYGQRNPDRFSQIN